jgi:hypothetical protein
VSAAIRIGTDPSRPIAQFRIESTVDSGAYGGSAEALVTPPSRTYDESITFEGTDGFVRHEWRRCTYELSVGAEPLGPPIVRCRGEHTDHAHTILLGITLPSTHTIIAHARTRTPAVIRCGVARELLEFLRVHRAEAATILSAAGSLTHANI